MSELANNVSFGRGFYFELGVYPSSYPAMTSLAYCTIIIIIIIIIITIKL